MQFFISAVLFIVLFIVLRLSLHFGLHWRRKLSTRLIAGEKILREQDFISLKVLSNKTLTTGPVAGQAMQTTGRMVLTDRRLLVATNHGRMLELSEGNLGQARAVGPRRLVVLGKHPAGKADLRFEMVVDQEVDWATLINTRFMSDKLPEGECL